MRTRYLLLNLIPAFVLLAVFVLFVMSPAHAAEVAEQAFSIDLSSIVDRVIEAIALVVAALAAWLGQRALTWLGLQNDATYRAYLDVALQNGIAYGKAKLAEKVGPMSKLETHNQLVALAATFAVAQVPGALARFGIDPKTQDGQAALSRLITARLPQS